jgi:hypothetical protein
MIFATLLAAFEWLQHTYLAEAIRHSAALIATLESIHLIGMALLIGTILMVDLSLLGHGIGRQPVARIARELRGWTTAGLAIMLASGPLILSSEAIRCYRTPAFWIKMLLLGMAVAFHFTIHRRVTMAEPPVARSSARVVASVSLALWVGVALAGKGIAIFQPTERPLANAHGSVGSRLRDALNYAAVHAERGAVGGRR